MDTYQRLKNLCSQFDNGLTITVNIESDGNFSYVDIDITPYLESIELCSYHGRCTTTQDLMSAINTMLAMLDGMEKSND